MKTEEDFRKLDSALQRFWERHGRTVDYTLCLLCVAWIAGYIGYLVGVGTRAGSIWKCVGY